MIELWKDIDDCMGILQVSNLGRVKRLERVIIRNIHGVPTVTVLKEVIKKVFKGSNGYPCVSICIDQVRIQFVIHRLIAKAFIENPENKPEVNHIDGNKMNFCLSNLEWCTKSENTIHAFKNGLMDIKGEKHMHSKLNNESVLDIRRNCSKKDVREYAKRYSVNPSTVRDVLKNRTWTHI